MTTEIEYMSSDIPSGLMSAVEFLDGFLVVDLTRTTGVQHFYSRSAAVAPPPATGLSNTAGHIGSPSVPSAWMRLAIVNGVDRWFDFPDRWGEDWLKSWNEDLIHADLALAHASVGNSDLARSHWEHAREALEGLIHSVIERPSKFNPLLRDELVKAYGASPFSNRVTLQTLKSAVTHQSNAHVEQVAILAEEVRRFRVRTMGGQAVLTDPRLVPARLLSGNASADIQGNSVKVSAPAHPSTTTNTPGAGRLLARVVQLGEDQRVSSFGALVLDGSHFVGELATRDAARSAAVIELFDSDSVGGPYASATQRLDGRVLRGLQESFSRARLASAARALGDESGAILHETDAINTLNGIRDDVGQADSFSPRALAGLQNATAALNQVLPQAVDPSDPRRPLLVELALELRLGVPSAIA